MPLSRIRHLVAPGIVPRVGDEVLARKSPVNPLVRARVRHVRPTLDRRKVRVSLVWLEGERAGQRGTVYARVDGCPPLIRPAP
ncbi:hypothetical protein ACFY3G_35070 [Streptomyces phaeochromogenes]|uniref:hypothetical protein n=1 Tax=Streptomyces phaeochromogenes TaxID=1923 RepID=UPI0036BA7B81